MVPVYLDTVYIVYELSTNYLHYLQIIYKLSTILKNALRTPRNLLAALKHVYSIEKRTKTELEAATQLSIAARLP